MSNNVLNTYETIARQAQIMTMTDSELETSYSEGERCVARDGLCRECFGRYVYVLRKRMDDDHYTCSPPPVYTGYWNEWDWLRYVIIHGKFTENNNQK